MPYVFSRPGWQNGRCGHSGGPPRTVALPEHLAAKSDSVLSEYLSASAVVTANAFWSAAAAGLPNFSPTLSPSFVSSVTVLSTSPDARGWALAPFTDLLRNSVSVPAYSGV